MNEECFWLGRPNMADNPSIAQEGWRIVDEGDRWAVWFIPKNHPGRWRELGEFATEREAVDYVKSL